MAPSAGTPPPIHCPECGSLLMELTQRVRGLEEDRSLLEVELRAKRGKISRLRKQQVEERPPEYEDAMEVALYWKDLLAPRAKELNGPRLLSTIERLHYYDAADLKKSLWGYYCRPNVRDGKRVRINEGGARYVDLALLMKDAKHVDAGIEIAEAEARYDQSLLNDGASRTIASLCDCGHPQADHALFYMHGHEHCLHKECRCEGFDDLDWQMEEFRRRSALPKRTHGKPNIPAPGQESLL